MADSSGWSQETAQYLSRIAAPSNASNAAASGHSRDPSTTAAASEDDRIMEETTPQGLGVRYERSTEPSPGSSFMKPPTAVHHEDLEMRRYDSESRTDTGDFDEEVGDPGRRWRRNRPAVHGRSHFGSYSDLR